MTLTDGMNFIGALADPTVKSKYFSMDSLTDIAYLKRKVNLAIKDYNESVNEMKVKVAVSKDGTRFIPIDDSEESKKNFKEFTESQSKLLEAEIPDLKTNFVTSEELKKVTEDTTLEVATNLIIHLLIQK